MVVGTEALGTSLGEAATGADLGGSSKYSKSTNTYTQNVRSFLYLKLASYTLKS